MQSQRRQNDLCSSPRQTIQYHDNPSLCPTSNTDEAEVEQFYEDLQDLLELRPPQKVEVTPFKNFIDETRNICLCTFS